LGTYEEVIGNSFGELMVLSQAEPVLIGKRQDVRKRVNVRCSCGKEYIVSERSLHENSSCGCVKPSLRDKRNLTGVSFGRWTVVSESEDKAKNGTYKVNVVCTCGTTSTVERGNLLKGTSNSCGCLQKEELSEKNTTHGESNTPAYVSWYGMLYRCDKNFKNYEDVEVCDRWNPEQGGSFENFLGDMGHPPSCGGYSINRIRGAKEYCKENCEWANNSIQGFDQKMNVRNTTGRTGVYIQDGKFRVRITKDRKRYLIGDFNTLEEAVKAREEAELKYYGFTKE
jgi:hypothetical protein